MLRTVTLCLLVAGIAACGHASNGSQPKTPPSSNGAPVAPKEKAPSFGAEAIDGALREAWKKEGVTPAPKADDATFLRRAYIDIVGTIPPVDVTTSFLADASPDKRKKLVDRLLDSPEYAEHWMNYWDDVLMGRESKSNQVDRIAFRYWLRARFAANSPWDRIVRDLVTASGQNSIGGRKIKGPAMAATVPLGSPLPGKDDEDAADLDKINGAVNWTLRFADAPQDFSGNASRVFLGVQIQCAQCHDHKTEKWKQDDFRKFTNAFLHVKADPIDKGKPMGNIKRVELGDAAKVVQRFANNPETKPYAQAKATALDGTDLDKGEDTRKALATWMTSPQNPWFAKAIVNRMWGHFLGRGFVDPVDDIRPSNPTTMPELLDRIAADFAAHDFDLKYLVRTICATEAYQLAASAQAKTDAENKLWGRFHLVPLGPEELLNALLRATNVEDAAQKAKVPNLDQIRANLVRQYAFLFDVDEENDEPDYSGTVSQALVLLNGALVAQGSRALPGSALAELVKAPGGDAEKVDALVLRVLGRKPTNQEREQWTSYVMKGGNDPGGKAAGAGAVPKKGSAGPLEKLAGKGPNASPKQAAYEDLLWALLNSSEFVFNH
jgi:hypothetical protein